MHVQSNGGWLGGWLGGWRRPAGRPKTPPPPPPPPPGWRSSLGQETARENIYHGPGCVLPPPTQLEAKPVG